MTLRLLWHPKSSLEKSSFHVDVFLNIKGHRCNPSSRGVGGVGCVAIYCLLHFFFSFLVSIIIWWRLLGREGLTRKLLEGTVGWHPWHASWCWAFFGLLGLTYRLWLLPAPNLACSSRASEYNAYFYNNYTWSRYMDRKLLENTIFCGYKMIRPSPWRRA